MTQEHPITPPPELLARWEEDWHHAKDKHIEFEDHIATQAARWGADQELEACCEYLTRCAAWEPEDVKEFCDHRRPKPPSLKEQAFELVDRIENPESVWAMSELDTIRRALESLPE